MSKKNNGFNWNDGVSLKEYLCQRLDDLEEKIKVMFEANKIALDKADIKMDARLTLMNEFREQMKDQTNKFITRSEHRPIEKRFESNIKQLELSRAMLEGKASQSSLMITTIISFIGLLIGLAGLIARFL